MSGDRLPSVRYWVLAVAAVLTSVSFYLYSSWLASDLEARERQRMLLWADAVAEVLDAADAASVDFPMRLVEGEPDIPALLSDADGNVLMSRNLPDDTLQAQKAADKIFSDGNEITIETVPGEIYRICYGDSALLGRLRVFPYVELAVILFFLVVTYLAIRASRKSEENRIWVGLSRETAHQLGTPVSSLMGWMECLRSGASGLPLNDAVREMERDVSRLSDVAARFSRIGTSPSLSPLDLSALVVTVADYMSRRVSSQVVIKTDVTDIVMVDGSTELLSWVFENMLKNAADAMDGKGTVTISVYRDSSMAIVDIADTGKGIPRNKWRSVFHAGYTTKGRGWGLGLTLARRIVRQYHGGSIAVVSSVIGQGTTFRITLPLSSLC